MRQIPNEVKYIIDTFETNGYEAYAVGGCVRDSLMPMEPKDWDICTSALPQTTMELFAKHHIIETGLKHGTITLMLEHKPFEITTYRIEGEYSDNRHPDNVEFVDNLKEDLSRRDFTINAMAYNPQRGIVDFFDGEADLNAGIIRCVGDAQKRFEEDALRIMRALRFAAVLGFAIDDKTVEAMYNKRELLKNIAAERIADELNKLIIGKNVRDILSKYMPVIGVIIPELLSAIGFEQRNPHHCYNVLDHILLSIDSAPKDVSIRLAMLFHDIAKPACYTETDGIGHFYGHPKISSEMAKEILMRLKYDNDTVETVSQLVLYHDSAILPDSKNIKRWLNKIGEERLRQLIDVKKADAVAQSANVREEKQRVLDAILALLNDIIDEQQCFSLKDLKVNGNDLIAMGVPEGISVGAILSQLMDMVIDEHVINDKAELLLIAQILWREKEEEYI